MNRSGIPYLTHSWSPVTGCSPVSEGCANCWSRGMAHRFGRSFDPTFHSERVDEPLRLRKPAVIGVCFNGDLFHDDLDDMDQRAVLLTAAASKRHTFVVLTKRAEQMRRLMTNLDTVAAAENVWLGVSVENQARADERIPILLDTPAAHRWVSLEPQIEAIDLSRYFRIYTLGPVGPGVPGVELVIQGCESGPKRRPFDIAWARSVRDQCAEAGVGYYLKQIPARQTPTNSVWEKPTLDGRQHLELPWEVKP